MSGHSRFTENTPDEGRELYGRVAPVLVILLVLLAGWCFRDAVGRHFDSALKLTRSTALPALGARAAVPESLTAPVPSVSAGARKDTVYRWTDASGITHFDAQGGEGRQALEVDQGKIQSLRDYKGPVDRAGQN